MQVPWGGGQKARRHLPKGCNVQSAGESEPKVAFPHVENRRVFAAKDLKASAKQEMDDLGDENSILSLSPVK